MTVQELSTMVRYGKSPIIFVLNNKGYTAERLIHDRIFVGAEMSLALSEPPVQSAGDELADIFF